MLSLLKSIPCDLPYDPWYKIGAAFKNLGGQYSDFENWSQSCSLSDWAGWSGMRLGLPTLLKYSSFYTGATETAVLFREAFGLNPESFPSPVLKINKPFTELTDITADTKGVLLKSRTGTGKSTLAFEKCSVGGRSLGPHPLHRQLPGSSLELHQLFQLKVDNLHV